MKNHEIIQKLQERADEQSILKGIPFSNLFYFLAYWLGNHSWRILIPIAFILTIIFHNYFGGYDELILKLFGKL